MKFILLFIAGIWVLGLGISFLAFGILGPLSAWAAPRSALVTDAKKIEIIAGHDLEIGRYITYSYSF